MGAEPGTNSPSAGLGSRDGTVYIEDPDPQAYNTDMLAVAIAVGGYLLLVLAFLLREVYLRRERVAHAVEIKRLFAALVELHDQLVQTRDNLQIIKAVLVDRKLINPADFNEIQSQLMENLLHDIDEASSGDEKKTIH